MSPSVPSSFASPNGLRRPEGPSVAGRDVRLGGGAWLALIALLVVACGGATATSPSPVAVVAVQPSVAPSATVSAPPYEVETPAPTPTPHPPTLTPYGVGDEVTFSQNSGGGDFSLTIKAVVPFFQKYNDPDPGTKYIVVDVLLEGSTGSVPISAFDFTVTDDAAYIYEISGMYKEPSLPYDTTLTTGKKVRGWLTFQVPKTMKSGAVVFADTPIVFTVK